MSSSSKETFKFLQCGQWYLSGLCPTLRKHFYPHYNFISAVKQECPRTEISMIPKDGKSTPKTRKVPVWIARKWQSQSERSLSYCPSESSSSSSTAVSSTDKNQNQNQNQALGIRLDNEVTELVNIMLDSKIDLRKILSWCYPNVLGACSKDCMEDIDDLCAQARVVGWLSHTKALVRFLYNQSWIPIRSQLECKSPNVRIGTKMDLLCLDTKNKTYVVVENKVIKSSDSLACMLLKYSSLQVFVCVFSLATSTWNATQRTSAWKSPLINGMTAFETNIISNSLARLFCLWKPLDLRITQK
jgi:hypothetical protein